MIILQFDGVYAHWGLLMLRSLALHEPGKTVLVDGVNLDPEQRSAVERGHPRVVVQWSSRDKTSRELMAHRKSFVLQRVMDEHPQEPWYCLMDVDFLVRRPLPDLWDFMRWAEAALIVTDGMWEGRVYQHLITVSSIVMVRPSGRPLIDSWSRWHSHETTLGGLQPGAWCWDQVTLLEAWKETPLRYATIPIEEFADYELRPGSAIWSGNVSRQDKDWYYKHFLKEHERQAARASV